MVAESRGLDSTMQRHEEFAEDSHRGVHCAGKPEDAPIPRPQRHPPERAMKHLATAAGVAAALAAVTCSAAPPVDRTEIRALLYDFEVASYCGLVTDDVGGRLPQQGHRAGGTRPRRSRRDERPAGPRLAGCARRMAEPRPRRLPGVVPGRCAPRGGAAGGGTAVARCVIAAARFLHGGKCRNLAFLSRNDAARPPAQTRQRSMRRITGRDRALA